MLLVWWGLGSTIADTGPREFSVVKSLRVETLHNASHAEHVLRIL